MPGIKPGMTGLVERRREVTKKGAAFAAPLAFVAV